MEFRVIDRGWVDQAKRDGEKKAARSHGHN